MKTCAACKGTGKMPINGSISIPCPFCKPDVAKPPKIPRAR